MIKFCKNCQKDTKRKGINNYCVICRTNQRKLVLPKNASYLRNWRKLTGRRKQTNLLEEI